MNLFTRVLFYMEYVSRNNLKEGLCRYINIVFVSVCEKKSLG